MATICPLCESGALVSATVDESINYGGTKLLVKGVAISRCDHCGEELVLPDQARANERVFADAKRQQDGLLLSQEIIAWRDRFGLTQQQAAKLLGGGANAFSKYERGQVIQSRAMDLLIRASDEDEQLRMFLSERAGVEFSIDSWETVVEVKLEASEAQPTNLAKKAPVLDIMAYRLRHAQCETEANDGQWHDEPAYAYGR